MVALVGVPIPLGVILPWDSPVVDGFRQRERPRRPPRSLGPGPVDVVSSVSHVRVVLRGGGGDLNGGGFGVCPSSSRGLNARLVMPLSGSS